MFRLSFEVGEERRGRTLRTNPSLGGSGLFAAGEGCGSALPIRDQSNEDLLVIALLDRLLGDLLAGPVELHLAGGSVGHLQRDIGVGLEGPCMQRLHYRLHNFFFAGAAFRWPRGLASSHDAIISARSGPVGNIHILLLSSLDPVAARGGTAS